MVNGRNVTVNFKFILMAACQLVLLVSCGGGGGGGGGGGDSSSSSPFRSSPPPGPEYGNSFGLDLSRAERAYGDDIVSGGITGAGVVLGIVDTQLFWGNAAVTAANIHSELQGKVIGGAPPDDQISPVAGPDGTATTDHGNAVAGIMVARRDGVGVHGIAPDATLRHAEPPEATEIPNNPADNGIYSTTALSRFNDMMIRDTLNSVLMHDDVLAVNNSWGYEGTITDAPYTAAAIRAAIPMTLATLAQAGVVAAMDRKILVWSAGNANGSQLADGSRLDASSPEILPGLPTLIPELQGHSLVVGSVDSDGVISSFSNRCGVAAAFCLVALGEADTNNWHISPNTGDADNIQSYTSLGPGSSFAAPLVTGALALLRQRFPETVLPNSELVTRILATADKTGIYSDTAIYGQGLLNVDAALTMMVGAPSIRTGASFDSGASYAVADSSLSLSGVMSSLRGAAAGQEVEVYDSINTPFKLPLSSFLEDKEGDDALQRLLAARVLEGRLLHHDENSYTAFYQGVSVDGRQLYGSRFWFTAGSSNWWFANGPGAQRHFAEPAFAGIQGFTSPYNSMAEGGFAIGTGGQGFAGTVWQLESYVPGTGHHSLDSVDTVGMVASLAGGPSSLTPWRVSAGMLHEGSSVLASDGTGAFAGLDARTWHAGLELAHHKGSWSAWAAAHVGITSGSEATSGILQGVDSLHSSSWALGLVRRSVFTGDDAVSFRVVQSLRAERGNVKLRLPDRRDRYGNLYSRNESLSLKPGGREIDFAFGWQRSFRGGAFSVDTGITTEPDHVAGAPARGWAGLAWRQQF